MSKNLANCKPSEFLKQTYRIKKSVERWLKDTDIINIRKHMPKLTETTKDMSADEISRVSVENRAKMNEQGRQNAMAILDAIMDTHADETLELLALCCFVEPESVDDYDIGFYLDNFAELIGNKSVMGFFTSLAQLGLFNTPSA